jgi:MYXO-CTERM domain-containing protein
MLPVMLAHRRAALAAVLVASLTAGTAIADAFVKGPYLQNVTRTEVTVMWQSDSACAGAVHIGTVTVPAPSAQLHEVRARGLQPGRRYAYTVECGARSAGGELVTAPEPTDPFSFVVFGDTRSNADQHRSLIERLRREVPDFILMTGDMVDDGQNENDWQIFFTVERELLRENVLFPSIGNHDRHGRTRGADAYRRYFDLPEDAPDPERYYAVSYGNTRILVLDSNESSFALTDQTAWLEKELAAAAADPSIAHRFVVMHHPPYSTSIHGGQPELREMWTPLFERFGVDAVFSGHDHVYERSEKNGIRYFVSGGGGAPLYPRDPRAHAEDVVASRFFERTLNYLRVHVVGGFVEVAALRQDGTLIENVSWGSLPQHMVAVLPTVPAAAPAVRVATTLPGPRSSGCSAGGSGGAGAPGAVFLVAALVLAAIRYGRRRSGAGSPPTLPAPPRPSPRPCPRA